MFLAGSAYNGQKRIGGTSGEKNGMELCKGRHIHFRNYLFPIAFTHLLKVELFACKYL